MSVPTHGARIVDHGFPGLRALVERSRRTFLFCRDGAGRPIGYAMNVMQAQQGSLWFSTYTKSAKVKHLRDDPYSSWIVIEHEGGTVRWCAGDGMSSVRAPSEAELEMMFGGFTDPRVDAGLQDHVVSRMRDGRRTMIQLELRAPDALTVQEMEVVDG